MKLIYILPVLLIVESFIACIPLFQYGKYGSVIYWLSAWLLNFFVIFLILTK